MSATTPDREKQAIGLPVAEFTLPLISGDGQRSLGDFVNEKRGAVVVFWSGLCSHCVRYDDYLNRFPERHPELGLVAVASRHGETAGQIRGAASERKLLFPI